MLANVAGAYTIFFKNVDRIEVRQFWVGPLRLLTNAPESKDIAWDSYIAATERANREAPVASSTLTTARDSFTRALTHALVHLPNLDLEPVDTTTRSERDYESADRAGLPTVEETRERRAAEGRDAGLVAGAADDAAMRPTGATARESCARLHSVDAHIAYVRPVRSDQSPLRLFSPNVWLPDVYCSEFMAPRMFMAILCYVPRT